MASGLQIIAESIGLEGMETALGFTVPSVSRFVVIELARRASRAGLKVRLGYHEREKFWYVREAEQWQR